MRRRRINRYALLSVLWAGTVSAQWQARVELSPWPLDRRMALPNTAVLGLSSSVLRADTLAFVGAYHAQNWSGWLQAYSLDENGQPAKPRWNAGALLDSVADPAQRVVLSISQVGGTQQPIAFRAQAAFDEAERAAMPVDPAAHTQWVDYWRSASLEAFRLRSSRLGALMHAQTLFLWAPHSRQRDEWPKHAPEAAASAQTYTQFRKAQAKREGMLYVAANDGMLHALAAPVPGCNAKGCSLPPDAGRERWAFVPRAVYPALAEMANAQGRFAPSVDATPVTRDVFFSARGEHRWHSLLVGGLRLGGRGVYALDVTDPAAVSEANPAHTVLWEFDADQPAGIAADGRPYIPIELGYTYAQPAIARLASGQWAVLIASGYFPDCHFNDHPLHCEQVQGASDHGSLFVLEAQTGAVLAQLRTPVALAAGGGLSTPVLGDSDGDQIDDVAFAGDLAGNLWRFDLASADPRRWSVSLSYRPGQPGTQPITSMPRLLADPATQRFMVVFGTGKYLGAGDTVRGGPAQSVYGIRDRVDAQGLALTTTRAQLQAQALRDGTDPQTGAPIRQLTAHTLSPQAAGWYVDLPAAGEKVVNTPQALFASNVLVIDSLIPAGQPDGLPQSSVLVIDAATGGVPGARPGDSAYAGVWLDEAQTSGSLPLISPIGGGSLLLPGHGFVGQQQGLRLPSALSTPLWRRRSWAELIPQH